MKYYLKQFTLSVSIVLFGICKGAAHPANLIIIMTDDQGYHDTGFTGATDVLTPHLDRLAETGVELTQGSVVHPVCGPSRAGLLTGRYPHRFGHTINAPYSPINEDFGVPTEIPMLSEVLKEAGYATGVVGKWHLGAAPKYHPNERGFDFFYGFLGGGHYFFPADYAKRRSWFLDNPDKGHPEAFSYVTPLERNGQQVEETEYLTDVLTREAMSFIDSNQNNPFFLYLAYNAPHKPLEATDADLALFEHIEEEDRRIYAAMLYAVDRGVGQIIEQLDDLGLRKNTLVVFLSDNGPVAGIGKADPFRGNKGVCLEGGLRVPFVLNWPVKLKPGTFDEPVFSLDLFPTFLAVAGLENSQDLPLDGENLLPYLAGEATWDSPRTLFSYRPIGGGNETIGVRQGPWKYYRSTRNNEDRLTYLPEDIQELDNLKKEYPEVYKELIAKLKAWQQFNKEPDWPEPGWYWKHHKEEHADVIEHYIETYGKI